MKRLLVAYAVCFCLWTLLPSNVPADEVEIAGVAFELHSPAFEGTETTQEQQDHLKAMIGGLSLRQFTRESQVAPVRIDLAYLKDADGNRVGHSVHVLFVVHCSLAQFSDDDFSKRWTGDSSARSDDSFSQPVGDAELEAKGIRRQSGEQYRRVNLTLLDQIQIEAVLKITHQESVTQNRIDLVLDERFKSTWHSTADSSRSGEYSGFRGWLTATELAGQDAVIVEARFLMREPEPWFSGSNFVRSKLPLALQKAARDLRRKLNGA
ncbi:hypothetical protein [Roseiconus lacunae]|uniref:Ribosome association toxin RatA n=1 Tax=Roseiconus lacunae TaxID=2605694 RepID=A0ABT7PQA6_9BACT|nr:hypothetical protein [Roseiconus lacunae]MDM4018677.1 hypothetical protein [Roseiconus lacunae]